MAGRLPSTHLRAAFTASGRCYGSLRLRAVLHAQGLRVGRYRIRTLMRINGLRPVWRRKFIHTTDSRHGLPIDDNVLNRHFTPATANAAWVSITYIRTRSGWLYLAAVLDLYSRKIVGWAMAPNMPARTGVLGLADGHYAAPTAGGPDRAFRPWQSGRIQPVVATPSNWRFVWGDPQGGKSR